MRPHKHPVIVGISAFQYSKQNHSKGNVKGADKSNIMNDAKGTESRGKAEPSIIIGYHQKSGKNNRDC